MWSRKIAQFATPRNRSSRRSRPFSGRIALIFMGSVSRWRFRDDLAANGVSAVQAGKIVTAQHNDYTGCGKYNMRDGESPINSLKVTSLLARSFPPRASMPHLSRGPIHHDRTHLKARKKREAIGDRQDQGMAARLRARAAPGNRAVDGLDLFRRHEAGDHAPFRHQGRGDRLLRARGHSLSG